MYFCDVYLQLHGCQILSYLHQQCSSGIAVVKTAFERYSAHT